MGEDEPGRDDRPCPRDPRGAWPAISHVSPACVSTGRWVRCVAGMFAVEVARRDDPAVPPRQGTCGAPFATARRLGPSTCAAHRLRHMRVRAFELRLIAIALVACWSVAAGLVLLAYRPGGPLDVIVGLTAMTPIAIALAGAIWPPVARGDVAFPRSSHSVSWPCCVSCRPSRGVVTQLLTYGSRTLLPSLEAVYPWLLALLATSLFSGFGIARRLQGGTAVRRRRLLTGVGIALHHHRLSGLLFAAVAVANEVALRDTPPAASRFGPTIGSEQPPACDAPLAAGPTARLALQMNATVDLRPLGSTDLAGVRVGDDFRWLAYVASDRQLGQYGSARIGDRAWTTAPGSGWTAVPGSTVTDDDGRRPGARGRLTPGFRATAEDHGVEVIEGARARRCRIAVDGATFRRRLPAGRTGSSGTPIFIAGVASSTTGSSLTASSARSRAAPTARPARSSRTRSTGPSTCG